MGLIDGPIDPRFHATSPERFHRFKFARRIPLQVAALLASLLLASACNPDSISDGPPAVCSESGVLCQLEKGPLGVCERTQCGPDETPPCFQCTPQH